MYFRNINVEKPNLNQMVLVKMSKEYEWETPFYICYYKTNECYDYFEEADGEKYSTWSIEDTTHWMPVEELNEIEMR